MTEVIACLTEGRIELLSEDGASGALTSPYQRAALASRSKAEPRIVSVTRGRRRGEVCYAIQSADGSRVFAQVPGSDQEEQLFFGAGAQLSDVDLSFAAAALACTVRGDLERSFIGLLADDGKGVRTITEGDVVDCWPRWAPGGRAEVLYASAGIGRTRSGAWAGLSPFSLHRLRFADSSVEVLVSDAAYDYVAPVPSSDTAIYALRRSYRVPPPRTPWSALSAAIRHVFGQARPGAPRISEPSELVRITPQGTRVLAPDVLAFDVGADGCLVYATHAGVFKAGPELPHAPQQLAALRAIERVVIC